MLRGLALAVSLSILLAGKAHAQPAKPVTLTWVAPLKNTDNSNYTNPAGYKVYWGTVSGTWPNSATINNPSTLTYSIPNLVVGTNYFFTVTAVNTTNAESAKAAPVSKVVEAAGTTPTPPTGLMTVGHEIVVYQPWFTDDNLSWQVVGTIDSGVPCNPAQRAQGSGAGGEMLYMVPRSAVHWYGDADAVAVYASCSGL